MLNHKLLYNKLLHNKLLHSALLLGTFTLVCIGFVAMVHQITQPLINKNSYNYLLKRLEELVPADLVDNDIVNDILDSIAIDSNAKKWLGKSSNRIYRGRKQGKPVAAIINTFIPHGYGGPIQLLVAVQHDGILRGVRVLSHKETPGLGDRIEETKSPWILSFTGKSLQNPPRQSWQVQKDGGEFDQLTGATITSRVMIRAIRDTLIFAEHYKSDIYR
ncbi:hypothetical protein TI05_06550 [Achromatium sp. WMS3]|nr:hypothetical protein TI05_06550 [Achromatium sp. WMS3]